MTLKEKWIAALRSGDYKQGVGTLRYGNEFCCLGVLCDVYHKETGEGVWVINEFEQRQMFYLNGVRFSTHPPKHVVAEASLRGVYGNSIKGHFTLVKLNDEGKADFNQIADLLESGEY